jgi:heterodisulfide reductase subunit A
MAEKEVNRAVLLCRCGDTLLKPEEAETVAGLVSSSGEAVYHCANLCAEEERERWADSLGAEKCRQLLVVGCPPERSEQVRAALADKIGLALGSVTGLGIPAGKPLQEAARAVREELKILALLPGFTRERLALNQTVLVVGGGVAGVQTASALSGYGYETILVERNEALPGLRESGEGRPAADLENVRILSRCEFEKLEGGVGAYRALLSGPAGREWVECGAVVLAGGAAAPGCCCFQTPHVLPLTELSKAAAGLPRRREARFLALALDMEAEETKSSTEAALTIATELQDALRTQVYILCHDLRVAAPGLEELYDQAREAGVQILKYEGRPRWEAAGRGLRVFYHDALLGATASLLCDLLGLSEYGLSPPGPDPMALKTGVSPDKLGRLQANNIHLDCGQTNRLGVFAVGACRGSFYEPEIVIEAQAAASELHSLLKQGTLEIELPALEIDPDRCALCLTCLRSCPHGALRIDAGEAVMSNLPGMCRRCGVCVGECPARAMSFPAWTEDILLKRAGG